MYLRLFQNSLKTLGLVTMHLKTMKKPLKLPASRPILSCQYHLPLFSPDFPLFLGPAGRGPSPPLCKVGTPASKRNGCDHMTPNARTPTRLRFSPHSSCLLRPAFHAFILSFLALIGIASTFPQICTRLAGLRPLWLASPTAY